MCLDLLTKMGSMNVISNTHFMMERDDNDQDSRHSRAYLVIAGTAGEAVQGSPAPLCLSCLVHIHSHCSQILDLEC